MSKFKVGDRVKGIEPEEWTYEMVGTVIETTVDGVNVKFDYANEQGWSDQSNQSDCWFHEDDELELLEPEAPEEMDPEVAAIAACVKVLDDRSYSGIARILSYLTSRYN